jgi:hypothetical protein
MQTFSSTISNPPVPVKRECGSTAWYRCYVLVQWKLYVPCYTFEGSTAKEEAWDVDKQDLDAAPWHCTSSRVASYPWIFGEARDDCRAPAPLLSRFGPCRLFPVPKVEVNPKSSPISDGRGDKKNSLQDLRAIPQNTFQDAFQNWRKRWERCMNSRGEYFEGDKSD